MRIPARRSFPTIKQILILVAVQLLITILVVLLVVPLIVHAQTIDEDFFIENVPVGQIALTPTREDASTSPETAAVAPPKPQAAQSTPTTRSAAPRAFHGLVQQKIAAAFPDAPVMVRIAAAESQFNPQARNPGSTATGLFQILSGSWHDYGCTGDRTDIEDNITCARKMYDRDGTRPWLASSANW